MILERYETLVHTTKSTSSYRCIYLACITYTYIPVTMRREVVILIGLGKEVEKEIDGVSRLLTCVCLLESERVGEGITVVGLLVAGR